MGKNSAYLKELEELLIRLRRLQDILNSKRPRKVMKDKTVIDLYKHVDTFLDKFVGSAGTNLGRGVGLGIGVGLGVGATGLFIGNLGGLFQYVGLDAEAISRLFTHARGGG